MPGVDGWRTGAPGPSFGGVSPIGRVVGLIDGDCVLVCVPVKLLWGMLVGGREGCDRGEGVIDCLRELPDVVRGPGMLFRGDCAGVDGPD